MKKAANFVTCFQMCWVIVSMLKLAFDFVYYYNTAARQEISDELLGKESEQKWGMPIVFGMMSIVNSAFFSVTIKLMEAIKAEKFENLLRWYRINGIMLVFLAITFFSGACLSAHSWDKLTIANEVTYFMVPFVCYANLGILMAKSKHVNGPCSLAINENTTAIV